MTERVVQIYSYDYSWASPKPQITGPNTLVKMSTLPKTEDIVDSSMLGTREAHPSHLVFVPKSMAIKDTSTHKYYWGDIVADSTLCGQDTWVPDLAPISPKGSLIHKIPKGNLRKCGLPSITVRCCLIFGSAFTTVVPYSMSAERFLYLMTLFSVYDLRQLTHTTYPKILS